ncbi:MAG: dihydropteroate synthase [Bacteroidales bacterium]|nr:dihydropteroate synthase [Bacteroidales bacterium]
MASGQTKIMGIINLNSDSFYAPSRAASEEAFRRRTDALLEAGADILDLGAISSRPGATLEDAEEEWARLQPALEVLARDYPSVTVSIDTFRASIVLLAYQTIGPFWINDISSGEWDEAMLPVAGRLGLRYIAMHHQGTFETMHQPYTYDDVVESVKQYFRDFAVRAREAGIVDWVLDPGFGFSKSDEDNQTLFDRLDELKTFRRPILVGVSRKRFIWRPRGLTPDTCGDVVREYEERAQAMGASIIRRH